MTTKIKQLNDKIDDLHEILKKNIGGIKSLQERIKNLESKVDASNMVDEVSHKFVSSIKNISSQKLTHHKPVIRCKTCDKKFNSNHELEEHMEQHDDVQMHNCEICDKYFILKWRLEKYMELHQNVKRRNCHYYNNNKTCLFEKIGCMFNHKVSKVCQFGIKCEQRLH